MYVDSGSQSHCGGNGVGGGTSAVPPVPTPLCVSVHHFQLYRCMDFSSVLVCWVRRLC